MTLILSPNMTQPDPFYAALLSAHEGLSDAESQSYNARLVLILANHIGDFKVLSQALDAAKVGSLGDDS
jgi:hypothetical protein|tara:strand:- start:5734 stop:5940 length:207 start_codon:yes stop_codon:yes gene_type:complete